MLDYFKVKTTRLSAFASAAAFLISGVTPLMAQQPRITKLTIESKWAGLESLNNSEILITKDRKGYRSGHHRISDQLVDSLLTALNAPPITKPDLQNLGIDQAWLDANAIPAVEKYDFNFDHAASNQKALYQASFTNQTLIGQVIPRLFKFIKMDDYPSTKVEVTFEDGSTASATSSSWYLFMLPWKVIRKGATFTTFDAGISRAVAALMPQKATNRYRIAGEGLDVDLAEAVMRYVEKDWKLLDVENRVAGTLAALRVKYTVESAEINPYHGVAFGVAWKGNQPHEENLHVVLRQGSFPQYFVENAILLFSNGKVFGTEDFLRDAGPYEKLVVSVPWLSRLASKYPTFRIELLWVHNRSFSEKAAKLFAADMDAIGKNDLAKEVLAEQEKVALITINYGDYWLILPDERMVLWRYETVSGLLNFKSADISTRRCSDYPTVIGGCVGAVVSPDGTLED